MSAPPRRQDAEPIGTRMAAGVVVGANHTGTSGGWVGRRAGLVVGAAPAGCCWSKRPVNVAAQAAALVVPGVCSYYLPSVNKHTISLAST